MSVPRHLKVETLLAESGAHNSHKITAFYYFKKKKHRQKKLRGQIFCTE